MSLKRFKTFEGIFTPCLLNILGVIMYLRYFWNERRSGYGDDQENRARHSNVIPLCERFKAPKRFGLNIVKIHFDPKNIWGILLMKPRFIE